MQVFMSYLKKTPKDKLYLPKQYGLLVQPKYLLWNIMHFQMSL